MGKKKLATQPTLREPEANKVLLVTTRNGVVVTVDDPIKEVAQLTSFEIEQENPTSDMDTVDPVKVADLLWFVLDGLGIYVGDEASRRLIITAFGRDVDKECPTCDTVLVKEHTKGGN